MTTTSESTGEATIPVAAPRARWGRAPHWGIAFAAGFVALVLGSALGCVFERRVLRERVLPGVTVYGEPFAGETRAQVEQHLAQIEARLSTLPLAVEVRGAHFELRPTELAFGLLNDLSGAKAPLDANCERILTAGRTGSWFAQFGWRLARVLATAAVVPEIRYDPAALTAKLDEWQRQAIADKPEHGHVTLVAGTWQPVLPHAGFEIERSLASDKVVAALRGQASTRVSLEVVQVTPKLSASAVEAAAVQAQKLTSASVALRYGEQRFEALASELQQALHSSILGAELKFSFTTEALSALWQRIRAAVERPSQDAKFLVDAAGIITIEPSLTRITLDASTSLARLYAAAEGGRDAEIAVIESEEAQLTTSQAQGLGITRQVASFTTYYQCCQPRVSNIERIADMLDGKVVLPGATFSLNEVVGPRSRERGFVAAPTIVKGEMEDTFGGGVSQFATTLFNAVFDGGYEIIERQAHSYYFNRYPLGVEATISYPKPDLIFKNDTASGLLIKTLHTKQAITVKLYGNNEGRSVKRHISAAFDLLDPPIDYVPDAELAPGTEEVKERGSKGFSIHTTRHVKFAGGEQREDRRKVTYNPRERVVAVHPCLVPKEDDDFSGEPCPEPEEPELTGDELEATAASDSSVLGPPGAH